MLLHRRQCLLTRCVRLISSRLTHSVIVGRELLDLLLPSSVEINDVYAFILGDWTLAIMGLAVRAVFSLGAARKNWLALPRGEQGQVLGKAVRSVYSIGRTLAGFVVVPLLTGVAIGA